MAQDEFMLGLAFAETSGHKYTLASTGLKMKDYLCDSRADAERIMHKKMYKHNLHIVNMYDDKHFKTYICNNNVRFYINRV